MATIHIQDLSLRTIIGIFDWEREKQQDIVINIWVDFDASKAAESDDIKDTVDYKTLKQAVISLVEGSRFNLVEKMAAEILKLAARDPKVLGAKVTIDKPHALRFASSVSVTMDWARA